MRPEGAGEQAAPLPAEAERRLSRLRERDGAPRMPPARPPHTTPLLSESEPGESPVLLLPLLVPRSPLVGPLDSLGQRGAPGQAGPSSSHRPAGSRAASPPHGRGSGPPDIVGLRRASSGLTPVRAQDPVCVLPGSHPAGRRARGPRCGSPAGRAARSRPRARRPGTRTRAPGRPGSSPRPPASAHWHRGGGGALLRCGRARGRLASPRLARFLRGVVKGPRSPRWHLGPHSSAHWPKDAVAKRALAHR